MSVLGTKVPRCGPGGVSGPSTAPPQLCSDDFPSLPLCLPPPEWQLVSCSPGHCLPSRCSPTSTPAVLFALIVAGELGGFQCLLESALMGGADSQVGFVSLSLSPSRIWGFDKYPDPEMKRVASRTFLSEVFLLEWHSPLGPLPSSLWERPVFSAEGFGGLSGVLHH